MTTHNIQYSSSFNKKEYGLSSLKMESSSYDSHHTDLSQNSRDIVVADQWVVLGKIGEGSFGEVFEGKIIEIIYIYIYSFLTWILCKINNIYKFIHVLILFYFHIYIYIYISS